MDHLDVDDFSTANGDTVEVELEKVYEQLDQREQELAQAAKFGQQLLESKSRLQGNVETLEEQLAAAHAAEQKAMARVSQLQRSKAEHEAETHAQHSLAAVRADEIDDLRRRIASYEREAAEKRPRVASDALDTMAVEISALHERIEEMERARGMLRQRLVDESERRSEAESELAAAVEARSLAAQEFLTVKRELERSRSHEASALEAQRAAEAQRDALGAELRASVERHYAVEQELRNELDEKMIEVNHHQRAPSYSVDGADELLAFDEELLLAMMEEEGSVEEEDDEAVVTQEDVATEALPEESVAVAALEKEEGTPSPPAEEKEPTLAGRVEACRTKCASAMATYYEEKNPTRVAGVGKILKEYIGRERTLFERLKRKYGDAPRELLELAELVARHRRRATTTAAAGKRKGRGSGGGTGAGRALSASAVSGGWLWVEENPASAFSAFLSFAFATTWVRKFFFLKGETLYERDPDYRGRGLGRAHNLAPLKRVEIGLPSAQRGLKTEHAFGLIGVEGKKLERWVFCASSSEELRKWHDAFAAMAKRRKWQKRSSIGDSGRRRTESTVVKLKQEILDDLEEKSFVDEDLTYFLRLSLAVKLELASSMKNIDISRLSALDPTLMYAESKALGMEFHKWHTHVKELYIEAANDTKGELMIVVEGLQQSPRRASRVGAKGR